MDTAERPVLRSRVGVVAVVVIVALVLVLSTVAVGSPVAQLTILLVAAGIAVGVLVWALLVSRRQRRVYEDELTTWAAERAAQDERLRIARELHDLASHGLGLITVRAAAARTVRGPAGDDERQVALADIERAGRAATTELRRMLAVLRSTDDDGAPLRPAETLADLPGIVADAALVAAELEVGELGEVTAGAQLAVCAVVREGLSNAARHAGPARVRVSVTREGAGIEVRVDDDGVQPGWSPHPGAGAGLVGLRERVNLLGGAVTAGPQGSGFRLTARIPDEGQG